MMTALLKEHGLYDQGWRFAWMNRMRTLGLCKYGPKQLLLSVAYVDRHDEEHVRQTCLHEVAHALTPGAKHGPEWVGIAYQLGVIDPKPCTAADMPAGRWQASCPTCAKTYSMHRRPKNKAGMVRYCPPCWKSNAYLPHAERVAYSELTFHDTQAPTVVALPKKRVSAPLSAVASSPAQTVAPTRESAPSVYTAPQLAASLGVDAKSFRAWLRKHPDVAYEYKNGSGYAFDSTAASFIQQLWSQTH